jgi:hypothetical protein
MAKAKSTDESKPLITLLRTGTVTAHLLGTSPLLMNRFQEKEKRRLLLPPRAQNRAARATSLKHDPLAEFRGSIYRCRDENAPTLVHLPDNSIKKAMAQAAIDTPGATKAEIGRLVTIQSPTVHLYGVPHLHMTMVRQADIKKTPDVRTRAYFPQWAVKLDIRYIRDLVTMDDILRLLSNAGIITGIGDGRQEKGSFSFGLWEIVAHDDRRWREIVKNGGRAAQVEAMENPVFADEESAELLGWYDSEILKRRDTPPEPAVKSGRRPKQQPEESIQ